MSTPLLNLPKGFADEIVAHALEDDPNECCGILAGKNGKVAKLYRMTNTAHSPYRYNMDPRELYRTYREIEDNGWEVLAIYHSHTHSEAHPSDTDVRLATWPDAYYILVSLMDKRQPVIRAFHIVDGKVTEEKLKVSPR
ncbi:MAG: M67 family metallopeptidase [Chloroflexi bacterium]|nr:M67 family metallopeptidase [Chloroflexota bacterium]